MQLRDDQRQEVEDLIKNIEGLMEPKLVDLEVLRVMCGGTRACSSFPDVEHALLYVLLLLVART